jgi:hypothetical protein
VRFARLATVAVALTLIAADRASAESKWSFKKLVPSLGKKDATPRGLYPEPTQPSIWRKMNNGTKTFFAKSKDAVPDWLMPGTQDRVRRSAGALKKSNQEIRGEVRTARRNIFAPWTQKDDSTKRPETVPDFLALPKPE